MMGDIIYKSLKIVNPNLRDHLETEDIKCPMLVNCHYTLHQALGVYSGLNLRCSEGIRSSLEEALKHLPGSSGAFLTFAGTKVSLMEFTVQGVDKVDSDHIRFAIFDSHSRDRTGAINNIIIIINLFLYSTYTVIDLCTLQYDIDSY